MSRSDRGVTIAPQVPQRLPLPKGDSPSRGNVCEADKRVPVSGGKGGGEAVGEGTTAPQVPQRYSSLKGRGDREAVGGYNASQTINFAFCIHLKGERAMRTPTTWYATQGVPYALCCFSHRSDGATIIGVTRHDTLSPRRQTKKVTESFPRDRNCEF